MDFIIREYNNDFSDVSSLLKESFPEVSDMLEESLISSDTLSLDKAKYIQLVCEVENKVVGYALASRTHDPILKKNSFWIDYVCVNSNYRGNGIGKLLINKIEEIARNENALFLQLTSSRFRVGARKMYSDLGFSIRESDIFRKVL